MNNDLASCVRAAVTEYLHHLNGEKPSAIHDMVIRCVEKPLIDLILEHAQGNQTRAAELLGINRNTLRKKMKALGIQ